MIQIKELGCIFLADQLLHFILSISIEAITNTIDPLSIAQGYKCIRTCKKKLIKMSHYNSMLHKGVNRISEVVIIIISHIITQARECIGICTYAPA